MVFSSNKWNIDNAELCEHLGREALAGTAFLKDVEFTNGIIEVDIAVTGARSYPGITFRIQSTANCERFYIRPHRAGLYPDTLQYSPMINNVTGWQLYAGPGFTSIADIPAGQWFHVKMEISGTRARVYLGNSQKPSLEIFDLKHGQCKGTIGLNGPLDSSAFFSNFSYEIRDIHLGPDVVITDRAGMIKDWKLSRTFKLSQIDIEKHPDNQEIDNLNWEDVETESTGLLDIARFRKRNPPEPDCVFAKTVIRADEDMVTRYSFGYSDAATVFLNGKPLFFGNSSYQKRDPSFLGIIGLNDSLYLPLKKGENELAFMVAEGMGGWGLMCQDTDYEYRDKSMEKLWVTEDVFLTAESILYDEMREVLYVSNFNVFSRSDGGSISKLGMDGTIIERDWIKDLVRPTAMVINGDRLYVLERTNLVEIVIDKCEVVKRIPVPGSAFLNDVVADDTGRVYISDSTSHVIFTYKDGQFERWIEGEDIKNANGLHLMGDKLITATNGDRSLKMIDLETHKMETIARWDKGIIDGIEGDGQGNLLVSHFEGMLYRVGINGDVTKLLDTTPQGKNIANFVFVPKKRMVIVPTFFDNRVACFFLDSMK